MTKLFIRHKIIGCVSVFADPVSDAGVQYHWEQRHPASDHFHAGEHSRGPAYVRAALRPTERAQRTGESVHTHTSQAYWGVFTMVLTWPAGFSLEQKKKKSSKFMWFVKEAIGDWSVNAVTVIPKLLLSTVHPSGRHWTLTYSLPICICERLFDEKRGFNAAPFPRVYEPLRKRSKWSLPRKKFFISESYFRKSTGRMGLTAVLSATIFKNLQHKPNGLLCNTKPMTDVYCILYKTEIRRANWPLHRSVGCVGNTDNRLKEYEDVWKKPSRPSDKPPTALG